jgi:hypothetical protein
MTFGIPNSIQPGASARAQMTSGDAGQGNSRPNQVLGRVNVRQRRAFGEVARRVLVEELDAFAEATPQ